MFIIKEGCQMGSQWQTNKISNRLYENFDLLQKEVAGIVQITAFFDGTRLEPLFTQD